MCFTATAYIMCGELLCNVKATNVFGPHHRSVGTCSCYTSNNDMYASSNGLGGAGSRGDCGHAITTISGCPGEISCSGHGSCDTK